MEFKTWRNPPSVEALIRYRVQQARHARKQVRIYEDRTRAIAEEHDQVDLLDKLLGGRG